MKNFRQKKIIEALQRDKMVNTMALAEEFGVSIETIRRDFDQLENQGIAKKVYGGAEWVDNPIVMPSPLMKRREAMHDVKAALAARAARYVPDRCTVALDAGSTIFELCQCLKEKIGLTVIASDIHSAAELLSADHKVYLMGGFLTPDGTSSGNFAKEFFNSIAGIDFFLCATDGAHPEEGLSTDETGINELKKRYLKKAKTRIAIIDHSKFQKRGFYQMCPFTDFDVVITDSGTSPDIAEKIRRSGVKVDVVDV